MTGPRATVRLLAALLVVTAAVLLGGVDPAVAQDGGWRITAFDVELAVTDEGDLLVTETIAVDFGGLERRGIFRVIPVRYPLPPDATVPDGAPGQWWRTLDVEGIRVTSPSAPADVQLERPGPTGTDLSIRIGDPDVTISGAHEYRITYRVRGALNETDGAPELYWNATGDAWPVGIEAATATVRAPAIAEVTCFAGYGGTASPCRSSELADGQARFASGRLSPGEGLTVAVRLEPGAVAVPEPQLRRRWSLGQAFVGSPWALPLAGVVAIAVAGGLARLLYRQGRDRIARGGVGVSGQVDPTAASDRRRGLLEPRPVPVEFRPPEGLRPGQLGLLIDERVDPVDISATIVDLAVRGHLTIEEEREKVLWRTRTDWILRRTEPPTEPPADELLAYEQRLLAGLFEDGDETRVSELTGSFATHYELAEGDLYDDAQRRHWFASRPDSTRSRWLVAGVVALVLAIGLTVLAATYTRIAIVGLPLIIGAIVLTVAHRWMPHRTGRGSALLVQALGFREFVATADADRLRFADAEGEFLPYLPYAVVFGEVERWSKAFADLGLDLSATVGGWYIGHGVFHPAGFSSGLSDFSTSAATALTTVPSSGGAGGSAFSGGGFSGGGFGGGGGGSW
ncbi:MAG: DUF2207 domain-containing protein [Actinobacteria bacterium]|nr:DUF2207 domain-containing protein [Actinomycetota bacterium]